MSMGMQVYLVDEAEVKAIPGSNDQELLDDLLGREGQGESIDYLDEYFADVLEECPGFTHADALRDIIGGQITRPEMGSMYVNTFEFVCSALGEWVHNHFHRCRPAVLTQLDELFKAHAVGLSFTDGLIGCPPVPLPDEGDGPFLGHWTEAEVRAAAPAFRAMRAAGPHGERWFEDMLDEVGDWIAAVEARQGSMLVASYG